MKKTISILLIVLMALCLASCGNTNSASEEAGTVKILSEEEIPDAKDLVPGDFIDPANDWYIYDNLIAQARIESDTAKRAELLHKAEDILIASYCITPLYNSSGCYLKKDYVSNIYGDQLGCNIYSHAVVSNGSDTLRMCLGSSLTSLDPALAETSYDIEHDYFMHSGLYCSGNDGAYHEDLAESMSVSEDGLTYTVKLKDNIKWSDGTAITAADFVYSWNREINPMTAAPYEYFLSVFDGYDEGLINATAIDERTLEFVLTAPCPYIKSLLSNPALSIVKQSETEGVEGWENSPGKWCENEGFTVSGPFMLTEWKKDCYMVFEKNPYYWDADKISVNRIELMLTSDAVTAYTAYCSGDIDLTTVISSDELSGLIDSESPECIIEPVFGLYYSAINVGSEMFEGKTAEEACCIRMALAMITDREYICDNILYSLATPVSHYIPIGMSDGNGGIFHDENDAEYYFDPIAVSNNKEETLAKARMYLQAAGFKFNDDGKLSDETPLNFEIFAFSAEGIPETLQQDFATLGIKTTIRTQNSTMLYTALSKGDFTYTYTAWFADFNDPICMLEVFTSDNASCYPQFGRK